MTAEKQSQGDDTTMQTNFRRSLYLVLILGFAPVSSLTALAAPLPVPPAQMAAQDSLYKRLGGYDALAPVTDDFIGRLATDAKLGRFFVGLSTDSKIRVRQHVVDFLCVATGGPCKYTGRDMVTAHTGLNITEDDWTSSVQHLTATLNKFKVPAREQQDVISAIAPLKSQIVGK
jgi:hemoglobin